MCVFDVCVLNDVAVSQIRLAQRNPGPGLGSRRVRSSPVQRMLVFAGTERLRVHAVAKTDATASAKISHQ